MKSKDKENTKEFSLQPTAFFAVSPEISGCGAFCDDYTFTHMYGRLVITEDLRTRRQTFFKVPMRGTKLLVSEIAFDINRNIFAVADEGSPPTLSVFSLKEHKNIFNFTPDNCISKKFTSVIVHCDSERVSALLGPPENMIYTIFLPTKEIEATTAGLPKKSVAEIIQLVAHPEDTFHYAILGTGILRFVTWMGDIWEDVFASFKQAEGIAVTTGTYTSLDTLLIGTADGQLMVISHEGIKSILNALTADKIFIEVKKKGAKRTKSLPTPEGNVITEGYSTKNAVKFMQLFQKGIAYLVEEEHEKSIHVFLKGRFSSDSQDWKRDTTYNYVPETDPYPFHGFKKIFVGRVSDHRHILEPNWPLYEVTNLAVSPSGKCIILTFAGRFLMIMDVKYDMHHSFVKDSRACKMLSIGLNKAPIEHITTCLFKNIFVTASQRTLKLYDYKNRNVFLAHVFQDNIISLKLHPRGHFVLVGFTDKIVVLALQQQAFLPMVELPIECCSQVAFSRCGDLVVIAEQTKLRVYAFYSLRQINELKESLAGKINELKVCSRCNHIWSSRYSGMITQTDIRDGLKTFMFPTVHIASLDAYHNFQRLYYTGFGTKLMELDPSQSVSLEVDLKHGKLTNVVFSKLWNVVIVGTETGCLLALKCPLENDSSPIFLEKMHFSPVEKIALSSDEACLISSAKDGSVCIWKLLYSDGSKKWTGCIRTSNHYPMPYNYKTYYNHKPTKELFDFQERYLKYQEKLVEYSMQSEKEKIQKLHTVLNDLKSTEFEKAFHLQTKFRRFLHQDYWNSLPEIGRDFIVKEQIEWEKYVNEFFNNTQSKMDVFKSCDEKAKAFETRYIDNINSVMKEVKKFQIYMSGILFNNVKQEVATDIEKQKKLRDYLKKECKKMFADIKSKAKKYYTSNTELFRPNKYLKEKKLMKKVKELIQRSLHRKIVLLLKLFKASMECRELLEGSTNKDKCKKNTLSPEKSPPDTDEDSETVSFINSENPSDSVNLEHSYLLENQPEFEGNKPLKTFNCVDSPEDYENFLRSIKKHKHELTKPVVCTEDCEVLSESNQNEDVPEQQPSKVTGRALVCDDFVIARKRGLDPYLQKHRLPKVLQEKRIKSALELAIKKAQELERIEKIVTEWKPDEANVKKMYLNPEKFIYFVEGKSRKNVPPKIVPKKKKRNMKGVGKMFDRFRHTKYIVNHVSPFYLLKKRITKSKFRKMMLGISPTSRLSRLATKHFVMSQQLIQVDNFKSSLNKKEQPLKEDNWPKPVYIDDPWTDKSDGTDLRSKPVSMSGSEVPNRSIETGQSFLHSELSAEGSHEPASLVGKRDPKECWDLLNNIANPKKVIASVTQIKAYIKKLSKKHKTLPKDTLPILKQLMRVYDPGPKKPSKNHILLPLKMLWVLRNIGVVKKVKIPSGKTEERKIKESFKPIEDKSLEEFECASSSESFEKESVPFDNARSQLWFQNEPILRPSDTEIWKNFFSENVREDTPWVPSIQVSEKELVKATKKSVAEKKQKKRELAEQKIERKSEEDISKTSPGVTQNLKKDSKIRKLGLNEELQLVLDEQGGRKTNFIQYLNEFKSYFDNEDSFPASKYMNTIQSRLEGNKSSFSLDNSHLESGTTKEDLKGSLHKDGRNGPSKLQPIKSKTSFPSRSETYKTKFKKFLFSNNKQELSNTLLGKGRLVKDGRRLLKEQKRSHEEEKKINLMWNSLFNTVYYPQEKPTSAKKSSYYERLWKSIFNTYHPDTVEDFEHYLNVMKKRESLGYRRDSFKLETKPEVTFDKVMRDCVPDDKDHNVPSDEIESISSAEVLLFADKSRKNVDYSLYSKQKVKLKTMLKNKVWFVPSKSGPGNFYYPGKVKWHEGYFLPYLKLPDDVVTTKGRKWEEMLKPMPRYTVSKNYSAKKEQEEADLQPLKVEKFIKTRIPLGKFYVLPIKLKRFWASLDKHLCRGANFRELIDFSQIVEEDIPQDKENLVLIYENKQAPKQAVGFTKNIKKDGTNKKIDRLEKDGPKKAPHGILGKKYLRASTIFEKMYSKDSVQQMSERHATFSCEETEKVKRKRDVSKGDQLVLTGPHTLSEFELLLNSLLNPIKVKKFSNIKSQRMDARERKISKKCHFESFKKIPWPEDLLKVGLKGATAEDEIPILQQKSINQLRKSTDIILHSIKKKRLQNVITGTTAVRDCIPLNNKVDIIRMPYNFTLADLNRSHEGLVQFRLCVLAKKLRRIQKYCLYVSKYRRPFHQENKNNAIFQKSEGKAEEKTNEFIQEYNCYRVQILKWIDEIKKAKAELYRATNKAAEEWEYLQKARDDIREIITTFVNEGHTRKTKEFMLEKLQKYTADKEKLKQRADILDDYKTFVIKNDNVCKKNCPHQSAKMYAKKKSVKQVTVVDI